MNGSDMEGLTFHHIKQISHICMDIAAKQSTYLKRLPLGPELFAFLVKLSLEGAFSVLLSSLETL